MEEEIETINGWTKVEEKEPTLYDASPIDGKVIVWSPFSNGPIFIDWRVVVKSNVYKYWRRSPPSPFTKIV